MLIESIEFELEDFAYATVNGERWWRWRPDAGFARDYFVDPTKNYILKLEFAFISLDNPENNDDMIQAWSEMVAWNLLADTDFGACLVPTLATGSTIYRDKGPYGLSFLSWGLYPFYRNARSVDDGAPYDWEEVSRRIKKNFVRHGFKGIRSFEPNDMDLDDPDQFIDVDGWVLVSDYGAVIDMADFDSMLTRLHSCATV